MSKNVIGFIIGSTVGLIGGMFAGYFYAKNKYLEIADKEIESVKKVYEKHFKNKSDNNLETNVAGHNPDEIRVKNPPKLEEVISNPKKDEYIKYASSYGGEDPNKSKVGSVKSSIKVDKPVKKSLKNNTPCVISPEEYRESDYESETLIWYSDKILADSDGNIIHNINEVIGPEALSTFGRYFDDTVYVRDDDKKIDYEIIWDSRKYSSVNNLADDKTLSKEESVD